jgi:ribokinase
MLRPMRERTPGVVVVGSINVDLIVGVRTLPGPGETVLGSRFVQQGGGKSANQSVAAARVGAAVSLLGAVGADDLGASVLAALGAAGVDVGRCRRLDGEHTGLALIVVDDRGENQIAVASGANHRLDGPIVEAMTSGLRPSSGAVCLLGFEVGDEAVLAAARWAAAQGLTIVVNPAPARPLPDALVALGPVLTPNAPEAMALAGVPDPAGAGQALAGRTGAPVIVTLGGDGAFLVDGRLTQHQPALAVRPRDTTGAGDALNGILAAELAGGAALPEALRWAMVGAAIKTTVSGAQAGLPDRATIAERLPDLPAAQVTAASPS